MKQHKENSGNSGLRHTRTAAGKGRLPEVCSFEFAAAGHPAAFGIAVGVLLGALMGPIFGFSDSWQRSSIRRPPSSPSSWYS
jgi:hypothetical protein